MVLVGKPQALTDDGDRPLIYSQLPRCMWLAAALTIVFYAIVILVSNVAIVLSNTRILVSNAAIVPCAIAITVSNVWIFPSFIQTALTKV